ncbi:MAG TPA: type II toxin-antitoxin system RelE/ParE family toxin [Rhizomicrobium sp.]|jgi:plasmid stabilization system protein ParE|nr:type II toxin-antitoxin system RelE/ParE family toxin [Rhizomicrobium sp.]
MASPIIRSLLAERDLVELFDYIAVDASEDRAEAVLRRIDQTLETLAVMPRIGRVRGDLVGSPRSFSIWPWLIIYEPQESGEGIYVWRIVDGRRDVPRLIGGRPKF